MIYLDANATTPVDPAVLDAMLPFLREHYANPAASYAAGRRASRAIEQARAQVAGLISARPGEIIFTSGGTESDNAAIAAVLTLHHPHKHHLITVKTEHAAVLEPAHRWAMEDRSISVLNVDRGGILDLRELKRCVRSGQTALVSSMWVNNETGVIAPISEIAEIAHAGGAWMHSDGIQAVGKLPISMRQTAVDYLSISGHKIHAPKGIGALYISKRVRFKPWILGGGQEQERRSGTENVPGIVALGKAAELMGEELAQGASRRIRAIRDAFEREIQEAVADTHINGSLEHRIHTTSSLCFPGVDAAGLLILLDERGVASSTGSACHAAALHPSHVLEAMGYDSAHAASTLRFSFSRFNTEAEGHQAAQTVIECVRKMKALRPGSGPVVVFAE